MKRILPDIACLFLIGIGLVAMVTGWRTAFVGEMHVALNTAERIAVRPTSVRPGVEPQGTDTRLYGVLGKNIPFNYPRNARDWIDPNILYDVAILPFAVALGDGVEMMPRHVRGVLKVSQEDQEETYEAVTGTEVTIGEETYVIQRVVPWGGLGPAPGNPPMIALALWRDSGELLDDLFIPSGAWVRYDESTAIHFEWVNTLDAARVMAAQEIAPDAIARWGVNDGERMDWLTSFEPGSGLAIQDGAAVTLVRRDPEHVFDSGVAPAIEVELAGGGTTRRRWLRVNEVIPDFPVRYEDLSRMPTVVHVFAWESKKAYLCVKRYRSTVGESVVAVGERWACNDPKLIVRIDDALPAAVAVHSDESALFETILQRDGHLLRVPEHRPLSVSTATLEFSAKVTPASVRYTLALHRKGGTAPFMAVLGPAGRVLVGGWELRQRATRGTSAESANITVRNRSADRVWYLGVTMLVVGLLGMAWRASWWR